jgi:glycosyltransferase involved in cell wall biosynthesis
MPFYKRKVAMFEALNNPYLVTISKAQAPDDNNLNIIGNVYNGLEMKHYPFSAKSRGYLLFVGTLQRKKGPHVAIKVAKRLGLPLILAAKLDPKHKTFFNEKIKPELGGNIRWIGEVTEEYRNKLMSHAMALLSPVLWEEPFGLTLIEAMSTGCPVISYKRGSTPEIIQHGKTGFIVTSLQDMANIVAKIPKIDRTYCREYSLANFSAQHMTQEYENIYKKVIEEQRLKDERMKKESTVIKRNTVIAGNG